MNQLIEFISSKEFWVIVGQIFIIAGLVATICLVVRELRKMPYGFWYILVNRIRYINEVGFFSFIWLKITLNELPDHPFNYSYIWLRHNKIYIAYFMFIWATLDVVYQMINQIATGYVYVKSKDFFISSPIRSMCILYIIWFLIANGNKWKKLYLEQMKLNGRLLDKTHKFDEIL